MNRNITPVVSRSCCCFTVKQNVRLLSPELDDFHESIQDILVLVKKFNEDVDREKLKTIGVENLLKATSRKQDTERQEIQSLIMEKTMELDRLKAEYQMLARIEAQQKEIIDNFYQNQ